MKECSLMGNSEACTQCKLFFFFSSSITLPAKKKHYREKLSFLDSNGCPLPTWRSWLVPACRWNTNWFRGTRLPRLVMGLRIHRSSERHRKRSTVTILQRLRGFPLGANGPRLVLRRACVHIKPEPQWRHIYQLSASASSGADKSLQHLDHISTICWQLLAEGLNLLTEAKRVSAPLLGTALLQDS